MFSQTEINYYMQAALKEAQKAKLIGEVPIGAVVVYQNEIIGYGHNYREHAQDATFHAEIMAIQEACQAMKSWRLENAAIFVTLEPCPMCAGAIINSRLQSVYYGAKDPKAGVTGSLMNLLTDTRFNHQAQVTGGILANESQQLLKAFFQNIRQKKRLAKKKAGNSAGNPLK